MINCHQIGVTNLLSHLYSEIVIILIGMTYAGREIYE